MKILKLLKYGSIKIKNSKDYLKKCVINQRFSRKNFNYEDKIILDYSEQD
ncbi:hypothetical protein [Clostridium sp. UBA871]